METQLAVVVDDLDSIDSPLIKQLKHKIDLLDDELFSQFQEETKEEKQEEPKIEKEELNIPIELENIEDKKSMSQPRTSQNTTQEYLRVPLHLVNDSLNNVWEIFLIKNQISYFLKQVSSHSLNLKDFIQKWEFLDIAFNRNINELENKVMKMRMTNLKPLFSRMSKIVRSYSEDHPEKQIHFVVEGEHVELDKKINDHLNEPLVHLVRNAIDHGIESIEERIANKKPKEAQLSIRAISTTDRIKIIVSDDGKGIDIEALIEKAFEKGRIKNKQFNEYEALQLIYLPGVSTSESISDISGRGMGMDAVKRSIIEMGGEIDLYTKKNKGSEFIISLPASLSVVPSIVMEVNEQKFGSNISDIVEIVQARQKEIDFHSNSAYFLFREQYIPCLYLRDCFTKYLREKKNKSPYERRDEIFLIIVKEQSRLVALCVDYIYDYSELIVKPTPLLISQASYIDGMSILPTGEPIFILSLINTIRTFLKDPKGELYVAA